MVVAIGGEKKDLDRGIPLRRVHGRKLWHERDNKEVIRSGHGWPPRIDDTELGLSEL